jgi:hypothetical protein
VARGAWQPATCNLQSDSEQPTTTTTQHKTNYPHCTLTHGILASCQDALGCVCSFDPNCEGRKPQTYAVEKEKTDHLGAMIIMRNMD